MKFPNQTEFDRLLKFLDEYKKRNIVVTKLETGAINIDLQDFEVLKKVMGPAQQPGQSGNPEPSDFREAIDIFRKQQQNQ